MSFQHGQNSPPKFLVLSKVQQARKYLDYTGFKKKAHYIIPTGLEFNNPTALAFRELEFQLCTTNAQLGTNQNCPPRNSIPGRAWQNFIQIEVDCPEQGWTAISPFDIGQGLSRTSQLIDFWQKQFDCGCEDSSTQNRKGRSRGSTFFFVANSSICLNEQFSA